jgi:2'-5' RNA ligase
MKRLFFALWPDQQTRWKCQQLLDGIRAAGKPLAADNIHVTVLFLGHVNEVQQQAMVIAAGQIKPESMRICFDRLAYWKKPAIVCLDASEQTDSNLLNLAEILKLAASQNGIAVEQRPYVPHVSLLRKAKFLPPLQFEPISWQSQSFCLVESCSTPGGVEYRVLQRWGSQA